MKSFVSCKVPNAGFCNQLLVWARAFVFAEKNDLSMVHQGWSTLSRTRIKRILRGNDSWLSMMKSSSLSCVLRAKVREVFISARVDNPKMNSEASPEGVVYHFNAVPGWEDFFKGLRAHRKQIIVELKKNLRDKLLKVLENDEKPLVVVHVRMGDFRVLEKGVDFSMVGGVRTPLEYFESQINAIREVAGWTIPVHIASDGLREELSSLLLLEKVTLAPRRTAAEDLLWMSQARLILCSAEISKKYFDGSTTDDISSWAPLLIKNIKEISQ